MEYNYQHTLHQDFILVPDNCHDTFTTSPIETTDTYNLPLQPHQVPDLSFLQLGGDFSHQDTPTKDYRHQNTPTKDYKHQDYTHQDTPTKDYSHQDYCHQNTPTKDYKHQDTPTKDYSHQDSFTKGVLVKDTPTKGVLVKDTPLGDQSFPFPLEVYQSLNEGLSLDSFPPASFTPQPTPSPGENYGLTQGASLPQQLMTSPRDFTSMLGTSVLPQPSSSPGDFTSMLGTSVLPQSTSPGRNTPIFETSPHPQPSTSPGDFTSMLGTSNLLPQSTSPGRKTPIFETSPHPQPSTSPGDYTSMLGTSPHPQGVSVPRGNQIATQGETEPLESTQSRPSSLKLKGGRRGRRSTQSKAPKLYERMEAYEDPAMEKKRKDAINSKQNRVRKAEQMEKLRRELCQFTEQRNDLQKEVQDLKRREMILHDHITQLAKRCNNMQTLFQPLTPPLSH